MVGDLRAALLALVAAVGLAVRPALITMRR